MNFFLLLLLEVFLCNDKNLPFFKNFFVYLTMFFFEEKVRNLIRKFVELAIISINLGEIKDWSRILEI